MPETSKSFVSVKFDAVGRRHQFLLPEVAFDPPLKPGDEVVIASGDRGSYGTVSRSIPLLDARRSPTDRSRQHVVRRASKKDVTQRLKQQQRERDAYRVAGIKIKERGLAMKLVRVEQQFDGSHSSFISLLMVGSTSVVSFANLPPSSAVVSRCDRSA